VTVTTHELELVAALGQAVARRIGPQRYALWFDKHTRFRFADGELTVGVPNRHFEEWLNKTFRDAVVAAAAEVLGAEPPVRFAIDPELFQAARREQAAAKAAREEPSAKKQVPASGGRKEHPPRRAGADAPAAGAS